MLMFMVSIQRMRNDSDSGDVDSLKQSPNQALHPTWRERRGCNPRVLWAGSLSLGH